MAAYADTAARAASPDCLPPLPPPVVYGPESTWDPTCSICMHDFTERVELIECRHAYWWVSDSFEHLCLRVKS